MYLKSLTLKGFKSFADRTVMRFEPGVSAIVGPNGSGKSNISDAVLWVLGERNAKNLRGQSMEDVIFAGSSARKPVSVAEVELLLDNSDGTLPVDFAEVSIGRRMYRSGESEYLINGNVVRRMDVLDILHDSGMGTGTNSIISQGNLDSVLSSRPEDRRALIEEAAGILKHKERKAKSERKLAQMDAHLARVNDITAEVERQLKPLERKARKAIQYEELSKRFAELRLDLAVDDLRILQKRWDEVVAQETQLAEQQETVKAQLDTAEQQLDALQQQLNERAGQEGSLNERFRRAQASFERLGSTSMLLREKKSSYVAEAQRLAQFVEEGRSRSASAAAELEQATATANAARVESEAAAKKRGDLEIEYTQQVNKRNDLRKQLDTLTSEQRALTHSQETIQAKQAALKESLSERRARAQVVDAHVADVALRLEQATEQAQQLAAQADELESALERESAEEKAARSQMSELVVARDAARKALDQARSALSQASAERSALEELERASEATNAAQSHLLDRAAVVAPSAKLLTHVITAPEGIESLVEALLGSDLNAVLAQDDAEPEVLLNEVLNGHVAGSVSVMGPSAEGASASLQGYERLMDSIQVSAPFTCQVEALLGQVYLVDTLEQALQAHRKHAGSTFASKDGCTVYPNGKITFTQFSEQDRKNSALARRRALTSAKKAESECRKNYEACVAADEETEAKLRAAQARSLKLSESVATTRGRSEAARRDADSAQASAKALASEHESLLKEQEENRSFFETAQPDSDGLEQELVQVQAELLLNKEKVEDLEQSLSPLRRIIVELSEKVSDARLEAARLSERLAYAERMEQSRRQEIDSLKREDASSQSRIDVAQGAADRAEVLGRVLQRLADSAALAVARLEEASRSDAQQSRGLHEAISQATKAAREVRERFDGIQSRVAEVRVEKGKLEVQVDAGVLAITQGCETSLETALALEPLAERGPAEEEMASLERRIKNLGTVNPDAAAEYEQVSERYAYLSSQLEDMMAARKSLSRIVRVIDERMRDDFITTFERVNANFSEIFSTLFPGGQAHLSLCDPEDLENTGVDVNAQPVGKRVKKMSLLSGGEKSMTAMALLFAVYRIRRTPFYILDEVEAALDDTNLRRLIAYINVVRDDTQFIMITHQRRTMESADILYGVSMQADGITKVLSQKLDNATRKEG